MFSIVLAVFLSLKRELFFPDTKLNKKSGILEDDNYKMTINERINFGILQK